MEAEETGRQGGGRRARARACLSVCVWHTWHPAFSTAEIFVMILFFCFCFFFGQGLRQAAASSFLSFLLCFRAFCVSLVSCVASCAACVRCSMRGLDARGRARGLYCSVF